MRTIVGISGPVGAGKSSLAKRVSKEAGAERVGFGNFVRTIAKERGISGTREELQQLGETLFEQLGADEFAKQVLAEAPLAETLIVDGVRHVAVHRALARCSDRYLLVFVTLEDDARRQRLEAREGRAVDLTMIDGHSTERDVVTLSGLADVIVSGSEEESWERVIKILRSPSGPCLS